MTNPILHIPTTSEYLDMLNTHDWYYSMSCDQRAYKRGEESSKRLGALAQSCEKLAEVLEAYTEYNFGNRDKPTAEEFETSTSKLEAVEITTVNQTSEAANDSDGTPPATPIAFTRDTVSRLVSDGKIFSVTFVKRTTGELRQMQARLKVFKHLKGGTKHYSDASKNLLTVYDMASNGYRSIPIENLKSLTVRGQTYTRTESQAA